MYVHVYICVKNVRSTTTSASPATLNVYLLSEAAMFSAAQCARSYLVAPEKETLWLVLGEPVQRCLDDGSRRFLSAYFLPSLPLPYWDQRYHERALLEVKQTYMRLLYSAAHSLQMEHEASKREKGETAGDGWRVANRDVLEEVHDRASNVDELVVANRAR